MEGSGVVTCTEGQDKEDVAEQFLREAGLLEPIGGG